MILELILFKLGMQIWIGKGVDVDADRNMSVCLELNPVQENLNPETGPGQMAATTRSFVPRTVVLFHFARSYKCVSDTQMIYSMVNALGLIIEKGSQYMRFSNEIRSQFILWNVHTSLIDSHMN